MKRIKEKATILGQVIGIALSVFLISFIVFASGEWHGPTASPPGGNVPAPISAGPEAQFKEGALGVGGIFEALGVIINPEGESKPTCDETTRGMMWTERDEDGDVFDICMKGYGDDYEWVETVTRREVVASGGDHVYEFVGDGEIGAVGQEYRVHAFTTTGQHNFQVDYVPEGVYFDVLVVGGGGGGGMARSGTDLAGGGGGAGGLVFVPNYSVSQGSIDLEVGTGGERSPEAGTHGSDGGDSLFGDLIAIGGGGGGSRDGPNNERGRQGGSSGGGSWDSRDYNPTEPLQPGTNPGVENDAGSAGGISGTDGSSPLAGAGGGGGAGESGRHGSPEGDPEGGYGGDGLYFGNIFGEEYGENGWFAGGGGAGQGNRGDENDHRAEGGMGGGAAGAKETDPALEATPHTGGGGGGGAAGKDSTNSSDGASGIVLVRYEI